MPDTLDLSRSHLATAPMPDSAVFQGARHGDPRHHPYRPTPDPRTGDLLIDPDILLKAKRFDLAISFYYSSHSSLNAEFGRSRAAGVRGQVVSSSATSVTVTRGDFRAYQFHYVGTSGGVSTFTPVANQQTSTTLSYDGTTFTEYFNDGMQMLYQAQSGGPANTYQLALVKDPNGVAQTYTYGTGAEAGLLKSIQVPGGNLVTFLYTAGSGTSLLQTIQDWGGRSWTFQYDSNNYLTTMTTPLGCQTGYTYSLAGGGVTLVQTITDPRGFVTSYQYDSNRRVTQMTAGSAVWTYSYGVTGEIIAVTSPSGAVTTSIFDANLNLSNVQHPEGYTSTFTYDPVSFLRISETVPAGTRYSITYDQKLWLPLVNQDALGNRTTMQYDGFGNLTTLTDANGAVTTYGYDGSGSTHRRIRQTDPLGRVTSYSYMSDGLLQTTTDPRGLVTTYNYDTYGNVASIVASDGGITTYQYDVLNPFVWDGSDYLMEKS